MFPTDVHASLPIKYVFSWTSAGSMSSDRASHYCVCMVRRQVPFSISKHSESVRVPVLAAFGKSHQMFREHRRA